jgi:hypothetical protein
MYRFVLTRRGQALKQQSGPARYTCHSGYRKVERTMQQMAVLILAALLD